MKRLNNYTFFYFVYINIKRIIDLVLSTSFLIFFFPILLFLAFSVWYYDGFPIIFKSERIGMNDELFTVFKFRTLTNGTKRQIGRASCRERV